MNKIFQIRITSNYRIGSNLADDNLQTDSVHTAMIDNEGRAKVENMFGSLVILLPNEFQILGEKEK